MKVIHLLNKIANGEEVPSKIKYLNYEYIYNYDEKEYQRYQNELWYGLGEDRRLDIILDDEVEIIEEPKGMPEKIDIIDWHDCIHEVTPKEKELSIEIHKTQELLNQVIDYLESKGE